MADTFDKKKRSWIMSRIRGKDTKPELSVRRFLHKQGFRYRLHKKDLPGKPDIVLSKYNTVILVHGCFWHNHEGCNKARVPKTRTEWWAEKMKANAAKDMRNQKLLKKSGWRVIIIWQCELRTIKVKETFTRLIRKLVSK